MSELYRGLVKWFNDAKGFGFIEHKSGKDVFVHYTVIEQEGYKTLKDGEEVDYELKEGEKGLHAARVVRVNVPTQEIDKNSETEVGAPEKLNMSMSEDSVVDLTGDESRTSAVISVDISAKDSNNTSSIN